jgi:hypothetical protein
MKVRFLSGTLAGLIGDLDGVHGEVSVQTGYALAASEPPPAIPGLSPPVPIEPIEEPIPEPIEPIPGRVPAAWAPPVSRQPAPPPAR